MSSNPTLNDGLRFTVFCLVGLIDGLEDMIVKYADPTDMTTKDREFLNLIKERRNTNGNHIQVYQPWLQALLEGSNISPTK